MADNIHAPEIVDSREALLERVVFLTNSAINMSSISEQDALDTAQASYELAKTLENVDSVKALSALNLGIILHKTGDEKALKYLNEALKSFDHLNDSSSLEKCHQSIGHLYLQLGNYSDAEKHLILSINMSKQNNSIGMLADTLNLLAGVYHYFGKYDLTRQVLTEAIELYEKSSNKLGIVKTSCNLGILLTSLGDYDSALLRLSNSHQVLVNELYDDRLLGITLNNMGQLYYEMNDYENSVKYFFYALENAESRQDRITQSTILLNIATSYREGGDLNLAKNFFTSSLKLCKEIRNTGCEVLALAGLAELLIREQRGPQALENLLDALPIAEELQDLETQLEILNLLGQAYALTGQWPEAEHSLKRGLELAQEVGRPKAVLEAHKALYEHFKQRGDLERALHHFEQFYSAERALLTEESDKRVRELSAKFDLERAQQETQLERLLRATAEDARNVALEQVTERTVELEQAQIEIVSRLALAAEFRDDITGEHTLRVGRYSAAVARRMGLDPLEVALIEQAARLHDVGKIGIPDSILLKPGKLTPAEYEFMKAHTIMGGRILSGGHSRLVKMAETIALSHHERWDGEGYPSRLSGEDIPLEGRIVAIADVFDALRQGRPYKTAWTKEDAWTELLAQSGKQFDPSIIEVFGRLLEDGIDEFSILHGQHD